MGKYTLSRILIIMFLALLLVYLPASGAKAIMVLLSLEELTEESDSVIIGTIVSSQSHWNNDRNSIYTTVIVALENHLKGNPLPDQVTVIVPGGEIDGIMQIVSDTPVFEPGEEVLLFLEDLPQQIYPRTIFLPKTHSVFGSFQGKKEIINNTVEGIPVEEAEDIILQIIAVEQTENELSDNPNEPVLVSNHQYVPLGIRWPNSWPVVSFRINSSEDYSNHVQAAAATWSNAGANFSFDYRGPHSRNGTASLNQVNEIMWTDLGTTTALALATIWCSGTTIIEADMVMNTRFNWTTNPFSYHDVQTVALHEFGHWIGLNHSPDYNSIMYHQYKGTQRLLSPDDIAGIHYIYGSSGTTGDDEEGESEDDLNQENDEEKEDPESQNDPDLETDGDQGDQQSEPEVITVPNTPVGPVSGYINTAYLYQAIPVSCPDGSATQYQYDWGQNSYSSWLDTVEAIHSWAAAGSYQVRVRARSSINNELISEWSEILAVNIYSITAPSPTTTPPPTYIPPVDSVSSPPPVQTNEPPQSAPLPEQHEKITGDLTGNGRVDVSDVTIVARFALGLTRLTEEQALAADINGDGTIDVRDTILLMRYVLGLIESLPATGR